ncbi:hypothetical protein HaLaN_28634 [Haematococcus lacustris]|uniref:Uncharacterized protein n=1 Tax=Haematococcus lacustris TaxID=44745 RepID=A0A6A0AAQ0_HAELA|nr:hypothetical protein HaLaN_28634 [Haematococcus lacustris]
MYPVQSATQWPYISYPSPLSVTFARYAAAAAAKTRLDALRAVHCWQPPRSRGGEGQPTSNDYFQFATPEGLGVGGAGHFAIW